MMKKFWTLIVFIPLIISVTFAQAPVANFTANATEGCGSLIVTFTDQSTNSPTSWQWTFGDGTPQSTLQNPTHLYASQGTFNVTLKATNGSGSNTLTKTAYIKVYHLPNPDFTGTPLAGCSPLGVQFTGTSTPGDFPITAHYWDFGDGFSGSVQNPNHVYNSAGSFQVTLTVTDQKGCTKNMVKPGYVNVGTKPASSFTYSSGFTCNPPITVNFNNTTQPLGSTSSWSFGDGGTSTQTSPSHNYNAAGNFTVTLISNYNGCTDTAIHVVNVQSSPFHPNFVGSPTSGCAPLTVNFTDLSPAGAVAWLWNFGDGGTSTTQNPIHTYNFPGTYTVKLRATNNVGCIDSIKFNNYITVYGPPTISFTGNPLFACNPPMYVQFLSNVPGALAWQWNFGDGLTGTTQNPNHGYTTNGTYTVSLTVTDIHGCTGTLVQPNYVVLDPSTAAMSMNPSEGCVPLTVQFTDQSNTISYVASSLWNFGDGSPTSNLMNPTHIYSDTGVYTVTHTITDSAGCVRTITGEVKVGMKPNAAFSGTPLIGCHPLDVQFTDLSSPFVNTWDWAFGDGETSDQQNPQHLYQDTGYFDVQLIVGHNGCTDTAFFNDYVFVKPPKPEFTANPTTGCVYPLNVQFTDQSILAQTWFWDFGDGFTSTQQNPSHTYTSAGFYNVKLKVTNSNGCKDSITKYQYIKISDIIPDFTQTATEICNDENITFLGTEYVNTYTANWLWDFGDGTTSTGYVITHTWASPGIYPVQLVVTDGLGCMDSITKPALIKVNALPHPSFSVVSPNGCSPASIQFTSTSTAVAPATLTNWLWDFGDGSTSTGMNPSHTYPDSGSYTITLTVTDSKGCDSTLILQNYIYVTDMFVDFAMDDSIICSGDTVHFTNLSTGIGLHYSWDFGDGTPVSTASDPWHIFLAGQTSTFTVAFTATDTNGCDSTVYRDVIVSKPVAGFTSDALMANCPPLFANFNDSSSNDVVAWQWNFGDPGSGTNNTSYIQDPQHFYNVSGSFNVTLIVTNDFGCMDTLAIPAYVTVNGPTGTFTFQPSSGCAPLDVDFVASAQSTTSYFWVFGDGGATTTTGNTASYTYTNGGTFIPVLVLNDSIHNCQLTVWPPDTVEVIAGAANFGFSSYTPCSSSANISFYDSSFATVPITGWLWEFGDGSTSTAQNPTHLYNVSGTYNVTLTVTAGGCSWTITINEVVSIFIPPAVQFDIGPTTTCFPPLVTSFTIDPATLTIPVTAYDWDFGDGSPHSSVASPAHTYTSSGTYDVTLTLTFDNGCQEEYVQTFVIVLNTMPSAGFYSDTNFVYSGTPINFIDTSTGVNLAYIWSFGDNETSTQQSPGHIYYEAGNFIVMLVVSTPLGCADTAFAGITILEDLVLTNVFTPNGDGVNDKFAIIASGYPDYDMRIFNRWGKMIFHSSDPYTYWDGTINGQEAAEGTYYFTLRVANSFKEKTHQGTVTLLR